MILVKSSKIGFLPGVKLALKNGANIHLHNDYVLWLASQEGHKDVVELLKKYGAKL